MDTITPQFITDNKGNKLSVLLSVKDYEALLDELEELEDIRAYDKAKKKEQTFIPAEELYQKIERGYHV
ncbi:MAG: hypothetical protein QM610_15785 [Chitinophagaceae bacterium]